MKEFICIKQHRYKDATNFSEILLADNCTFSQIWIRGQQNRWKNTL